MATIIVPNAKAKTLPFKKDKPEACSFAVPFRSFVTIKTSTSDVASADSTLECGGKRVTHRATTNLLRLTLPAGSHPLTVTSSKDATFSIHVDAMPLSRLDALKSVFGF